MIPKIIHLCWFSGDPFPADIVRCLETWNDKLMGYKIWLWGKLPSDEESLMCLNNMKIEVHSFDLNSTNWTHQAFDARKYAFAADYVRLYALCNYGGIYLDADVLVYKSFDELLNLPYFIGCDQIRAFEAAVIGAEKGCRWIQDILDIYKDREFVLPDGSYDMLELPVRIQQVLTGNGYKFYKLESVADAIYRELNSNNHELFVFGKDFFNSRDAVEVHPTKMSFCAHNYAGSWQTKKVNGYGLMVNVKRMMPKWMLKMVYTIGQKTWAKNKYSWFQIPFSEG